MVRPSKEQDHEQNRHQKRKSVLHGVLSKFPTVEPPQKPAPATVKVFELREGAFLKLSSRIRPKIKGPVKLVPPEFAAPIRAFTENKRTSGAGSGAGWG